MIFLIRSLKIIYSSFGLLEQWLAGVLLAGLIGWDDRLNGRWAIESVGGLELAGRFWLGLIGWLDSSPAKNAQPNKALNFTIFM